MRIMRTEFFKMRIMSQRIMNICNVTRINFLKKNFILCLQYSASELTKIALCILRIPTSSAASECNWSAFSYIHDKKRNRLTSERVFKLVYIYSNYKLQQPQKCCSIDIDEDENEDNEHQLHKRQIIEGKEKNNKYPIHFNYF